MTKRYSNWIPLVSRHESPLWVTLVCEGVSTQQHIASLGWEIGLNGYKYENGTHWVSEENSIAMLSYLADKNHTSANLFHEYIINCARLSDNLSRETTQIQQIFSSNSGSLSEAQLRNLVIRYFRAARQTIPLIPSFIFIQNLLEITLRLNLSRIYDQPSHSTFIDLELKTLLVPSEDNDVAKEARDLLHIAAKWENHKDFIKKLSSKDTTECPPELLSELKRHKNKYGWLRTYAYLGKESSVHELLERIRNHLINGSPSAKLEQISIRNSIHSEKATRLASKLKDDLKAYELIHAARDLLYWRSERVDVHFRTQQLIRPLLTKFSKCHSLQYSDFVYLTQSEIRGQTEFPTTNSLKTRKSHNFCVVRYRNTVKIIDDYEKEHTSSTKQTQTPISEKRILTGVTAMDGNAAGRARIIRSSADLHLVKNGDILITRMTTPDLILAMERAGAIITEEGGILCHAAVVAREIGVPCVIGVSSATLLINNGELIRVEANNNIGKISRFSNNRDEN